MKTEIERKFFVKNMPDLTGITPQQYERYFLERGNGKEIRITRVDATYKYESKTELSALERTRDVKTITKEEFDRLKGNSTDSILRTRYIISSQPNITIQVYHGRFEGLVRAEVEFDSEADAIAFKPLAWMGDEMTDLPIARDGKLIGLSDQEFKSFLL